MTNEINDSKLTESLYFEDLLNLILGKKLFIILFTSLFSVISIVYSLYLPNVYHSEALLAPANSNSQSISGMAGQFGGLASMAGISLPGTEDDKTNEAIERIKSFEFFSTYFLPYVALEDLMASEDWDPQTNALYYDNGDFETDTKTWIRSVSFPRSIKPSAQEAYETYLEIMNVSQNKSSSFVYLSFEHYSPYVAREWTDLVIKQINISMRDREKAKLLKSIQFLNDKVKEVNYEEVKQSIFSLQEEQIKSLMLVEANDDYIFEVINSPVAAEMKSEPKRSLMVILATLGGFILSVLYILISFSLRKVFINI